MKNYQNSLTALSRGCRMDFSNYRFIVQLNANYTELCHHKISSRHRRHHLYHLKNVTAPVKDTFEERLMGMAPGTP